VISILLHWNGFGLVSKLLVIYYRNVRSYSAGILTVSSNQITYVVVNKVALILTGSCTVQVSTPASDLGNCVYVNI
jgi:hypothetical protein